MSNGAGTSKHFIDLSQSSHEADRTVLPAQVNNTVCISIDRSHHQLTDRDAAEPEKYPEPVDCEAAENQNQNCSGLQPKHRSISRGRWMRNQSRIANPAIQKRKAMICPRLNRYRGPHYPTSVRSVAIRCSRTLGFRRNPSAPRRLSI